jgi:hypothetical protein
MGRMMRARVGAVLIVALFSLLAFGAAGCSGGGSEPAASRKCRSLANFAESVQQFATFLAGRRFDIARFAEEDWVRFQALDLFAPPDEIRDDVHVLAVSSAKFVDAIAGVDLSNLDQESLEELQVLWTEIDQQRVTQAAKNISAWVQETCPYPTEHG